MDGLAISQLGETSDSIGHHRLVLRWLTGVDLVSTFSLGPEIAKTINDQLLSSTNFLAEKIAQQTELLEGFSREMHDAAKATYQVGADIEKVLAANAKSTVDQIGGPQQEVIRLHDAVLELKMRL